MTSARGLAAATDAGRSVRVASLSADARMLAYWVTLGAAAGGLGGLIAGGVGGRLAMLVLRLTSPHWVRGMKSDDGFVIGRFDLSSTLSLMGVTTLMGTIVGLVVVFGRPFFPHRWMPLAWTFAGGAVGGGLFIHTNGVDFNSLEPTWLAIALFILVPACGGGLIAYLVELYHEEFWWRRRVITAVAALPALVAVVFFPVALTAAAIMAGCLLALRSGRLRRVHEWLPSRVAAWAVFTLIVGAGLAKVTSDTRELL